MDNRNNMESNWWTKTTERRKWTIQQRWQIDRKKTTLSYGLKNKKSKKMQSQQGIIDKWELKEAEDAATIGLFWRLRSD